MTEDDIEARILRSAASAAIPLEPEQAGQLTRYLGLLQRWNKVHNLTGLRDVSSLVDRGLIDSLRALPLLPAAVDVVDVGSGAGFPAIPLAVAAPTRRYRLVEPRRKRVTFLEEVRRVLDLPQVEVWQGRVEQLEAPVALITSRAVGRIGAQVAARLVPGGAWVVASTPEQIDAIQRGGGVPGLALETHHCDGTSCWMRLRRVP